METLERVFHSVKEENKKTDKLVKKKNPYQFSNDEEHNNRLLDTISECKEIVNNVNNVYLNLFEILNDIYEVDPATLEDKDHSFLNKMIKSLNKMNKQVSRFFSELMREKALREGCQSPLMDLRINIRSMRETIADIEDKLVDKDDDTDQLIDDLLGQF